LIVRPKPEPMTRSSVSARVGIMEESLLGTATLTGGMAPSINVDGPCLTGTLAGLTMPPEALVKIKSDAIELLSRIVRVYSSEVAPNEVGASGSGKASDSIPTKPCTGLLYGRIQSGKTVAMIALVAAAIDNGFRVIVVLTSDNLKLVSQTTDRFAALDGPIAVDALSSGWEADHKHIGKKLGQAGVVFVCSKNKTRLDNLIQFLDTIGAPNYPALVLDDEADQATLDANLARSSRAKEKGQDPVDPTAIYDRVARQLSPTLRHHVFLQVTATPYALLLQSVGTKLRPSFVRLLEPGTGYTGGEAFFEAEHVDGPKPPLVFVPENEADELEDAESDAPDGLRKAMAFFLVAAAAQAIVDPARAKNGQNFLCHTSQLRTQHRVLEGAIRNYVDRMDDHLEKGAGEALTRLHQAYDELLATFPDAPSLTPVLEQVKRRLVSRRVVVVNSEADTDLGKGLNFIVGGNILGRGVTIDNLLVTYYLRQPKTGQMDTMLQHARMYGYRAQLMQFTRVFLPQQLAVRFHEIHRIEQRLRRQLVAADMGRQIVIEKAANLKPTRGVVLDPTYIDAFDAEDQCYPIYPDFRISRRDYEAIQRKIVALLGEPLDNKHAQTQLIDYDALLELIELLPYNIRYPSARWIPGVLRRVVERQRERCQGRAYLHTRRTRRKGLTFTTGALSGEELKELRMKDGPVICAFRDDGSGIKDAKANEFWYPTLVLDHKMPSLIVNTTPDAE
jgi:Z1 domain